MDFFQVVKDRKSIRNFREVGVSEEDLKKIIECAIAAPSAGNVQPWEFVMVRSKDRKVALARAALNQEFIAEAPVAIVVLANLKKSSLAYGERGATLYCLQDTAAAIENMLLAAHALGLGACWVGAFRESEVARVVNATFEVRPIAIISIGYPASIPRRTSRRSLEEVTHNEIFGG